MQRKTKHSHDRPARDVIFAIATLVAMYGIASSMFGMSW